MEALEAKFEAMARKDQEQDDRITEHGRQIDELYKKTGDSDINVKLLQKDWETMKDSQQRTEASSRRIEDKVDKLVQDRFRDHYEKPLSAKEKIESTIISVAIGGFVGYIVSQIIAVIFK